MWFLAMMTLKSLIVLCLNKTSYPLSLYLQLVMMRNSQVYGDIYTKIAQLAKEIIYECFVMIQTWIQLEVDVVETETTLMNHAKEITHECFMIMQMWIQHEVDVIDTETTLMSHALELSIADSINEPVKENYLLP